jgi:hypothetical protein
MSRDCLLGQRLCGLRAGGTCGFRRGCRPQPKVAADGGGRWGRSPLSGSCRLIRNGFLILLAGGCALLFQQRLDPPAGAAQ